MLRRNSIQGEWGECGVVRKVFRNLRGVHVLEPADDDGCGAVEGVDDGEHAIAAEPVEGEELEAEPDNGEQGDHIVVSELHEEIELVDLDAHSAATVRPAALERTQFRDEPLGGEVRAIDDEE